METVEKECGALGGLFQAIVNDMKVGRASLSLATCIYYFQKGMICQHL
jgi:hypothetical protein